MNITTRNAGPDDAGRRLDKVLRRLLPAIGLSDIYASLRKKSIKVNGKPVTPDYRLTEGDVIAFPSVLIGNLVEAVAGAEEYVAAPLAGKLVVLETADLLFLNKPRGMLSHGPGGLDEMVAESMQRRMGLSLSFIPGPLHRLDRNTSGLIVFPRSAEGARVFSQMLHDHRIGKRYIALLEGELEGEAVWEDVLVRDEESKRSRGESEPIPGLSPAAHARRASSRVVPLLRKPGFTLAMVEIHTGLTHQIRAQAALHGCPLAGDSKYGGRPFIGGFILHALGLEFADPPFGDVPRRVLAGLPNEAASRLRSIFGSNMIEKALATAVKS